MASADRMMKQMLADHTIRSSVNILHAGHVTRLTRRCKPDRRASRSEFVLTVGEPNHAEDKFIKKCIKDGERFTGTWTKHYKAKR